MQRNQQQCNVTLMWSKVASSQSSSIQGINLLSTEEEKKQTAVWTYSYDKLQHSTLSQADAAENN